MSKNKGLGLVSALAVGAGAVSYTHLDVYKRQVQVPMPESLILRNSVRSQMKLELI